MTESNFDWLADRARSGDPATDAYNLDEVYPGERNDLMRELRTALAGCPDIQADAFAAMMQAAVHLNALPVLRAVVALWRGAYRDLLDQLTPPSAAPHVPVREAMLSTDEQARLASLKGRIKRR